MARFILRRVLLIVAAILVINFLGFTYAHYARPLRAARTPYVVAGEAGPLIPAYTAYLQSLVNRDFSEELNLPGGARSGPLTLGDTLRNAVNASMGLLGIALLVSVTAGLIIGLAAVRQEPPGVARWLTGVSTVGLAMPSFYIGSLMIVGMVFYVLYGGPEAEMPLPLTGFGWDAHLVLPTLALIARPIVQVAQVTAALLSSELGKQYVTAGRAIGYTWRMIRNKYALRNIVAPLVLTVAGMLRFIIGELVLVEWLFLWPGLGRLLAWTLVPAQLSSSRGSPLFLNPAVMAAVLTLVAALFLITDFLAAVLVRSIDPRTHVAESESRHV